MNFKRGLLSSDLRPSKPVFFGTPCIGTFGGSFWGLYGIRAPVIVSLNALIVGCIFPCNEVMDVSIPCIA